MSNHYRRLGELLVSNGLITNLQLSIALAAQLTSNRRIGDILVERGFVTEDQIAQCLAEQYGYPLADLDTLPCSKQALVAIGPDMALSLGILPVSMDEHEFECVIGDPVNIVATDQLSHLLKKRIKLHIAPQSQLLATIRNAYGLNELVAQEMFEEMALIPKRFANAQPRRRSGQAAFFHVWDTVLHRNVALASVPADGVEEHGRLLRATAKAVSPYVCAVHDWFEHEQHMWSVFESLEGETLEHVLRTRGPRSVTQAARLVADIAEGVDALHQAGGWCGLISPANVLVRSAGVVLAPFTVPDQSYSAPELTAGEKPTPSSDIFALGTLLWECVSGGNPHIVGQTRMWQTAVESFTDIPPAMAEMIDNCVARDPAYRYGSAVQLSNALRSYNWSVSRPTSDAAAIEAQDDRDHLLTAITGADRNLDKPSFWQRLFGRQTDRAA